MPRVSIVMTVYNGGRYLDECLKSILNQTYKDFELIITDNHSTDETSDIIKKYSDQFENLLYYRSDVDMPVPRGRNKGFSLATGEYWTRMDSDDIYYPNAIEEMVSFLDSNPQVGCVYCDYEIIDADGQVQKYKKVPPIEVLIYGDCVGGCVLYRASLAKQVGEYSEEIGICEYDFWLRFNQIAVMKPLNTCLLKYRMHTSNLSEKNDKQDVTESRELRKKYYHQYIKTRRQAAIYYAYSRRRDIYSKWRQFYLIPILFYSPSVFYSVVFKRTVPDL